MLHNNQHVENCTNPTQILTKQALEPLIYFVVVDDVSTTFYGFFTTYPIRISGRLIIINDYYDQILNAKLFLHPK